MEGVGIITDHQEVTAAKEKEKGEDIARTTRTRERWFTTNTHRNLSCSVSRISHLWCKILLNTAIIYKKWVPITDNRVPICLKCHYTDSCFNKCKFRETHGPTTSRQENGLESLPIKCKDLKISQRSQKRAERGENSWNADSPSIDADKSKNLPTVQVKDPTNFIQKIKKRNVWKNYQLKMRCGIYRKIVVSYLQNRTKNA